MKTLNRFSNTCFGLALAAAFCLIAIAPARAQKGDPAVWSSSAKQSSAAYIDASAFCATPGGCVNTADDFCNVLNQALYTLQTTSPNGGVVDARGINPANTESSGCGSSPFLGTHTITVPSTLLLPAGTISVGKIWVLPNATKIIGEGTGISGYGVTTLAAKSTFAGTYMIQMGPGSGATNPCSAAPLKYCTDVGVEDLTLQGNGTATVSGIINGQSQDMSYVRRVNMYQIGGVGLKVWQGDSGVTAENSGPYIDIVFDAGTTAGSSNTVCAEILTVSTRGIRGLTCQTESGTVPYAVQISGSNNSVHDAHISGSFTDGIQVTNAASNILLFNVTGGTTVEYLIDLLSGNTSPNVSIMGASNGGSTYTLYDEMTATKLNDPYLAMYILGESGAGSNGYSRFTTSLNPNAVTWGQGSGSLPSHCNKGDLFSNTSSTGNLYVCTTANTWSLL